MRCLQAWGRVTLRFPSGFACLINLLFPLIWDIWSLKGWHLEAERLVSDVGSLCLTPASVGTGPYTCLAHIRDEGQVPFSEGSLLHSHPALIVSKFFHLLIAISILPCDFPCCWSAPLEGHKSHLEDSRRGGWSCLTSREGLEPALPSLACLYWKLKELHYHWGWHTEIFICYIVCMLNGITEIWEDWVPLEPAFWFFSLFNKFPTDQLLVSLHFQLNCSPDFMHFF